MEGSCFKEMEGSYSRELLETLLAWDWTGSREPLVDRLREWFWTEWTDFWENLPDELALSPREIDDWAENRSVTAVEGHSSEHQDEEDLWGILPDELPLSPREIEEALAWDWTDNRSVTAVEGQSSEPQDEDLWDILPDELLERIFALLPVTNIFRAGAVCKGWNSIIASSRFLHLFEEVASTRPWYFMFKNTQNAAGLVYDPVAKKWHNFELPRIDTPNRFVASVNGLVCFMDCSNGYDLYICNPMTKATRKLPEPSKKSSSQYYTASMTVNKATKVQTTAVVRSDPIMLEYYSRLSIEIYDSSSKEWRTTTTKVFLGRRGVDNGVICNGFFYCVIHSTYLEMVDAEKYIRRHGLITYQLSSGDLKVRGIGNSVPCSLTCVRLMNCNNKLVMVGGIGYSGIINGIGIWELVDTEWREVAKMPNNYFRGFDVFFSSSGSGDLIYIHAFGSPQLFLYDMSQRSWSCAKKCPMVKEHPLQRFTGFCFEPSLEACA